MTLAVQLVRAADQTDIFARRYETTLAEMFALERAVAQAIGEQIGIVPVAEAPGA